jgi:hypothetical protein
MSVSRRWAALASALTLLAGAGLGLYLAAGSDWGTSTSPAARRSPNDESNAARHTAGGDGSRVGKAAQPPAGAPAVKGSREPEETTTQPPPNAKPVDPADIETPRSPPQPPPSDKPGDSTPDEPVAKPVGFHREGPGDSWRGRGRVQPDRGDPDADGSDEPPDRGD